MTNQELLEQIAQGLSDTEIARAHHLTISQVKARVRALLGIHQARNRTHLVAVLGLRAQPLDRPVRLSLATRRRERREAVMGLIRRQVAATGCSPTSGEIAAVLGVAPSTAWQDVVALEAAGRMRRGQGHRRFIPIGEPTITGIIPAHHPSENDERDI